jgi:non-ribosomal peptide synthetase component E (peptide arylation enzyme)
MNSNNEYLGVPFEEKLVPFPNFASVLLQHAREFPQKIALIFEDRAYTYLDLLKECLSYNINDVEYEINLVQVQDSIILILALLTQGKNFKLDFLKSGTMKLIILTPLMSSLTIKHFY